MYIVKLLKQPDNNIYKEDYFPRWFYYKEQAEKLKKEVEEAGGIVTIQRKRSTKKH